MWVINLYGAPGSGKSTVASGLFYWMRTHGYNNAELALEPFKDRVFDGTLKDLTQYDLFSMQANRLHNMRTKGVGVVLTDCPLMLNLIYAKESEKTEHFVQAVKSEENQYKNLNIVVTRSHPYQELGRIHSRKEAEEIGKQIVQMLHDNDMGHYQITSKKSINDIGKHIVLPWVPLTL